GRSPTGAAAMTALSWLACFIGAKHTSSVRHRDRLHGSRARRIPSLERLEDRLAPAGVTLITHGLLLGLSEPMPAWVSEMADAIQQDRKSTRLNSSHVAISYAVFCLK